MITVKQLNLTKVFGEKEAKIKICLDTSPPPEYTAMDVVKPCNCICRGGEALISPSCGIPLDTSRPITTLPPAQEGECNCKVLT